MQEIHHNVFEDRGRLYTANLVPGQRVYGERLQRFKNLELREWDPYRSKLAAAMLKGMKAWPFAHDSKVLYLGAAQGTTPSHVSDICEKGAVVCVEISQKAFEKLYPLCESRENMVPVLADANMPEKYEEFYTDFDVLYQDVAQPNQASILLKNSRLLKRGGYALIAIKARSIDVAEKPEAVIKQEIESLKRGFEVLEGLSLNPFDKDHAMIVCRKPMG